MSSVVENWARMIYLNLILKKLLEKIFEIGEKMNPYIYRLVRFEKCSTSPKEHLLFLLKQHFLWKLTQLATTMTDGERYPVFLSLEICVCCPLFCIISTKYLLRNLSCYRQIWHSIKFSVYRFMKTVLFKVQPF